MTETDNSCKHDWKHGMKQMCLECYEELKQDRDDLAYRLLQIKNLIGSPIPENLGVWSNGAYYQMKDSLEKEICDLKIILEKYGNHFPICKVYDDIDSEIDLCDCGYNKATKGLFEK